MNLTTNLHIFMNAKILMYIFDMFAKAEITDITKLSHKQHTPIIKHIQIFKKHKKACQDSGF